jgi:hypothetical protein
VGQDNNFAPRFGFAYLLHPNTVVRGGYGLIWFEQAGITTPFTTPQFPFLQSVGQRTLDNINPAFVLQSGPSVTPLPFTPDAGLGQGVFAVNRPWGSGYSQQWNLAVQHQFSSTVTMELGYSGNKITNLGVPDVNLNQLTVDHSPSVRRHSKSSQSLFRSNSALVLSRRPNHHRRSCSAPSAFH